MKGQASLSWGGDQSGRQKVDFRRGDGPRGLREQQHGRGTGVVFWAVVKELNLSYYIGETIFLTIYPYYGKLKFLNSNPVL